MAASKKVVIIGGGIGGLTVAHELAERGYSVDVYEKSNSFGGKAKSYITEEGYPGEHSIRIVSHTYYHLRNTLKRIPDGDHTVFDNVVAPPAGARKYILFKDYPPAILPGMFPWTWKDIKEYLTYFKAMNKIVPKKEEVFFTYKILKSAAMSSERAMDSLENMTWGEYIDAENKSAAYRHYLHRLPEFYVAARADSNAKVMSLLIQKSVFMALMHPIATRYSMHDLFNAPTSEAFIEPWVTYLKKLGVRFHTQVKLEHINMQNGKVSSVDVMDQGKKNTLTADMYVFALPVEIMREYVKANSAIAEAAPSLRNLEKLRVEGSSGIQFYVTNEAIEKFPDGWTAFMDSPWAYVGIFQSKSIWKKRALKPPVTGILTVTWSNFDEPGVVYKKPMRECTAEEIKEETLAQLKMHQGAEFMKDMKFIAWHVDPELEFDPVTGRYTKTNAPLFLQTPGCYQYQPEAYTEIPNLYLAADYVRTSYNITTMEAANEAGRRAANAILKNNESKPKYALARTKVRTGLGFLQWIDHYIYKFSKWISGKKKSK